MREREREIEWWCNEQGDCEDEGDDNRHCRNHDVVHVTNKISNKI